MVWRLTAVIPSSRRTGRWRSAPNHTPQGQRLAQDHQLVFAGQPGVVLDHEFRSAADHPHVLEEEEGDHALGVGLLVGAQVGAQSSRQAILVDRGFARDTEGDLPSGPATAELLRMVVRRWHDVDPALDWEAAAVAFPADSASIAGQIARLGPIDCLQRHLEDDYRAHDECPPVLTRLRHAIDAWNQRRASTIDETERLVAGGRAQVRRDPAHARPAVVPPANLVDHLSILELKRHRVLEPRRGDAAAVQATVALLGEQIDDLSLAIDELAHNLITDARRSTFYRAVNLDGAT